MSLHTNCIFSVKLMFWVYRLSVLILVFPSFFVWKQWFAPWRRLLHVQKTLLTTRTPGHITCHPWTHTFYHDIVIHRRGEGLGTDKNLWKVQPHLLWSHELCQPLSALSLTSVCCGSHKLAQSGLAFHADSLFSLASRRCTDTYRVGAKANTRAAELT